MTVKYLLITDVTPNELPGFFRGKGSSFEDLTIAASSNRAINVYRVTVLSVEAMVNISLRIMADNKICLVVKE